MQLLFISGPEILFILLIVVLLFGAKRLPEIAKGLGKGVNEFKRATEEIKQEITTSSEDLKSPTKDIKDEFDELTDSIKR